jgi:elongation factor G
MKREFNVLANVGAPQVAYKESFANTVKAEGKYIKQSGGRGQFGHCWLRVEPKARGEGNEFVSEIKGGAIPAEFVRAVEKGVWETLENGVLLGYPVVDVKVACYDGSYHDVDSSEVAFKIAASQALQAASKMTEMNLLEPIMKVEVTTPSEFMGDVMGDLSSRVRSWELKRSRATIINTLMPLSELSGYTTDPIYVSGSQVTTWKVTMM